MSDALPLIVRDAAAYLALAAGADVEAAHAAGVAAAADDRAAGLEPAASPAVLWALLAAVAPEPDETGERPTRAATRTSRAAMGDAAAAATAARVAHTHAALVACLAHCAPDGEPGTPTAPKPPLLAPDPEVQLARGVAGRVPPGAEAWAAYLASLAVEVAGEGPVARLAGPLTHVAERAADAEGEAADEVQDVVVAAYDAAAAQWSDDTDVEERQGIVASGGATIDRAIADGRAARGWHLIGGAKESDDVEASAARVAESFAAGVSLWREVVRAVVAGEVELAGARWRRTLWTLQVAFGVGADVPVPVSRRPAAPPVPGAAPLADGPVAVVVTGDPLVLRAAVAAGLEGAIRGA